MWEELEMGLQKRIQARISKQAWSSHAVLATLFERMQKDPHQRTMRMQFWMKSRSLAS